MGSEWFMDGCFLSAATFQCTLLIKWAVAVPQLLQPILAHWDEAAPIRGWNWEFVWVISMFVLGGQIFIHQLYSTSVHVKFTIRRYTPPLVLSMPTNPRIQNVAAWESGRTDRRMSISSRQISAYSRCSMSCKGLCASNSLKTILKLDFSAKHCSQTSDCQVL